MTGTGAGGELSIYPAIEKGEVKWVLEAFGSLEAFYTGELAGLNIGLEIQR